ncbi:hypothetical protein [Flavisphingomonas formosensis]|uniref:hypothetical protein n=1 Tax=Flavisphingomonas formosensis TaxID=861534 RepID=UPI0012F86307|nr:hypothetical protein [Sphingomonas formosensis]
MAADSIERVNFYQYQYLGAEDLQALDAYHRDMRRRHNLGPHSWGIVTGATIAEVPREGDDPFVDIVVMPGVVVDGFGREMVIFEQTKIDPELFLAYATDRHLELWIQYDELAGQPATGGFAPCTDATAYSRITETFRFFVGTPTATTTSSADPSHDFVDVGGSNALPAASAGPGDPIEPPDASIPYQEFPAVDRAARWLVQLGWVHWDGTVRKFRPAASADIRNANRRYAGFVGGSLLVEGPGLLIAPRIAPADVEAQPFAEIAGRVIVDGSLAARKDVNIEGGRLQLLAAGGTDETRPLWMQRLGAAVGSGADLRIHIGDTPEAVTRLTVGPGPQPTAAATEKVVFAVAGDDKVYVPTGTLFFQGSSRPLIDLGASSVVHAGHNAFGRQGTSVYYRSEGSHYWYLQGVHDNADGNPGAAGVQQLELTAGGTLRFGDPYRHMIEASVAGQTYAVGAQDRVLYMRSDRHFAWYRGGAHNSGQFDPGGGAVAMTLDNNSQLSVTGGVVSKGDVQLWGTRLRFLTVGGGEDTDPLEIARINWAPDRNDLRVMIGDNLSGDDRFVVGTQPGGGAFQEQFIVENDGDVRVARDLWVGGRKPLIDVYAGEAFLNRTGAGSGTVPVPVTTRLPAYSNIQFMVALSDIANINVATDARWAVHPGSWVRTGTTSANINVNWTVNDSDGQLFWFSYVVIFLP